MKGKAVKKLALFALVAVLSSGFVGCASSLESDWGLQEEGDGHVSRLEIDIQDLARGAYCVTIVYCDKEATTRVSGTVYERLVVGQSVKLRLASVIMKNESDVKGERFCDATYWWQVPGVTDGGRIITFRLP
ncbi:MAG: hypothetical protein G01um101419_533 [Parcubacteria group bacterium Gr01-1014_19]|nr:MAG: hypothetical protein G01um101419_533 [Parcubacteria group bacterium Gr01-1014_19]